MPGQPDQPGGPVQLAREGLVDRRGQQDVADAELAQRRSGIPAVAARGCGQRGDLAVQLLRSRGVLGQLRLAEHGVGAAQDGVGQARAVLAQDECPGRPGPVDAAATNGGRICCPAAPTGPLTPAASQ